MGPEMRPRIERRSDLGLPLGPGLVEWRSAPWGLFHIFFMVGSIYESRCIEWQVKGTAEHAGCEVQL
jgi:hypothetical protein